MPGQRILLVESDPVGRKYLKALLLKSGYKVVGVTGDGINALKTIRTRQPDLVIVDTGITGGDGLEVARIIYEDKIAPVVVLAAAQSQPILQKAKEARVFALLTKPVHEVDLLSSIELALANHSDKTKLETEVRELKETLETRKLIDQAKGILMVSMGFSEEEAFRRMQKQSMNNRISMRQVAEAVILAHSLQKP